MSSLHQKFQLPSALLWRSARESWTRGQWFTLQVGETLLCHSCLVTIAYEVNFCGTKLAACKDSLGTLANFVSIDLSLMIFLQQRQLTVFIYLIGVDHFPGLRLLQSNIDAKIYFYIPWKESSKTLEVCHSFSCYNAVTQLFACPSWPIKQWHFFLTERFWTRGCKCIFGLEV